MTNKEMFQLSQQIAHRLKGAGIPITVAKHKQLIYDSISPLLKDLVKPNINTDQNNTTKDQQKDNQSKKSGLNPTLPTDKQLRVELKQHLITKLANGQLQAAEIAQLKDIFGLANAQSDLQIELIDYKSLCDDCPKLSGAAKQEQEGTTEPMDGLSDS